MLHSTSRHSQSAPTQWLKRLSVAATLGLASQASVAADLSITVTNLTHGMYNTPLLIAAHPADTALFQAGEAASASLQAMAEGGDISGLVTDLGTLSATVVENPAGGLLAPGTSTTAAMNTDGTDNVLLSVVAMLLPTNDGFMGLNAVSIPTAPGTYTFNVNAYDAGTEVNDEIVNGGGASGVAGIPAAPGGAGGTGGSGVTTTETNTLIHIHRNNLGDTNAAGGASDVDSRVHRWLNPVARVVVTVN